MGNKLCLSLFASGSKIGLQDCMHLKSLTGLGREALGQHYLYRRFNYTSLGGCRPLFSSSVALSVCSVGGFSVFHWALKDVFAVAITIIHP